MLAPLRRLTAVSQPPSILHELELQTHADARAIVEPAELGTRNVVLHVARIEMVGDVEEGYAGAAVILLALEWNRQPFHHQHIERQHVWVTAARIARAHEILLLVQY